jgi:hypothetical protein
MRWKRRDGVMNAAARRVQRVYLVLLRRDRPGPQQEHEIVMLLNFADELLGGSEATLHNFYTVLSVTSARTPRCSLVRFEEDGRRSRVLQARTFYSCAVLGSAVIAFDHCAWKAR